MMVNNQVLFEVTTDKLWEVGIPEHLSGFDIIQDIVSLYIKDPKFRKLPLLSAVKYLFNDDTWDYSKCTELISKARYAEVAAFRNKEAWTSVLPPFGQIPTTQDFCLMMAEVIEKEIAKKVNK